MAKNDDDAVSKIEELKAELKSLKGKKKKLNQKSKTTKTKKKDSQVKEKKVEKKEKKVEKKEKKVEKKEKKVEKKEKKVEKKEKKKAEAKKKVVKKTKEEKKEEEKTLEEQLEEELSDAEIENFQIEKVDMEKLTHKVCDVLFERESSGMIQSELWKKLKLTSRDGSRLSLKLERMGTITREKILENGRWTYKLLLKKTPISTTSIENAPCLICPVEQKCSLDGEISPRTCQWIEEWVTTDIKKPKKEQ
jgi:chromosome segregation ATPase